MVSHPAPRIVACFADLVDPRGDRTKRQDPFDIITIALCGVICGAESWVQEWGDAKRAWLETWLRLPNGIPSHEPVWPGLQPDRSGAVRSRVSALGARGGGNHGGGRDCRD